MRLPIRLAAVTVCGLIALGAFSQNQPATTSQVDSGKIIQFLSQTVSWYHQRAVEQKLANEASDLTYAQENRRIADQVVPLAFEFARNQAQVQSKQSAQPAAAQPTGAATEAAGQSQRLSLQILKLDKEIQDTQAELQDARDKLAKSSAAKRQFHESLVSELQSEVGLLQARRDAVQSMIDFVNSSSTGGPKSRNWRAPFPEYSASRAAACQMRRMTLTLQKTRSFCRGVNSPPESGAFPQI